LKEPLSTTRNDLNKIKGVGKMIESIALEILDTGKSLQYKQLMAL